jgi:hypothetical protein
VVFSFVKEIMVSIARPLDRELCRKNGSSNASARRLRGESDAIPEARCEL